MRHCPLKLAVLFAALSLALLDGFSLQAKISAANLAKALDNPPGITFFNSDGDWSAKTGTVSGVNIKNVPSVGNTYLEGKAPGRGTPQKQNSFRFQVQGAGTLHFRYQVSLDYYNDSALCLHLGNYEEDCLWEDSDILDDFVEPGADWWLEEEVYFDGETYTNEAVFAILGPDDEFYEKLELDKEYGEKLYSKAWLDSFVWEPDEDMQILFFEPDPEQFPAFDNWQYIYIESDYDNVSFRYTTDGSLPNLNSPLYDPEQPIVIDKNTTVNAIAYEGNNKIGAAVYRASYQLMTAAPQLTLQQDDFADFATVSFSSETPDACFYYSTNDQAPERLPDGSAGPNTFKGKSVRLTQSTTLQVMACAEGLAESLPLTQDYIKLQNPNYSYEVDSNSGNQHAYFDYQVELSLSAASGSRLIYELNGDRHELAEGESKVLLLEETSSLRFQAQQEGKLHSETVTLNFVKTDKAITLEKPAQSGWHLLFLPGEVSLGNSEGLIEQLQPYAYDSQKKCYYRPTLLRGGQSYWYFVADPDSFTKHNFAVAPVAPDLPSQTWFLGGLNGLEPESLNAWLWDLTTQKYSRPSAETSTGPAWLFKQK